MLALYGVSEEQGRSTIGERTISITLYTVLLDATLLWCVGWGMQNIFTAQRQVSCNEGGEVPQEAQDVETAGAFATATVKGYSVGLEAFVLFVLVFNKVGDWRNRVAGFFALVMAAIQVWAVYETSTKQDTSQVQRELTEKGARYSTIINAIGCAAMIGLAAFTERSNSMASPRIHRGAFWRYTIFFSSISGAQAIAYGLIWQGIDSGICFLAMTNLFYYTLTPHMFYYALLVDSLYWTGTLSPKVLTAMGGFGSCHQKVVAVMGALAAVTKR
jgi:hypothetical protein